MDSVLPVQVDEPENPERMKHIDKRMIRKAETLELGTNRTRDGKSMGSANDSSSGSSGRSGRSRGSREERET